MKRFFSFLLFSFCSANMLAQDYQSTPQGLKYKVYKDEPGTRYPVNGDIIELNMRVYAGDSLVVDSREVETNNGMPAVLEIKENIKSYDDLTEGLKLMTAGDSAVFLLPVDVMKNAGMTLMPWMKAGVGQMIKYEVALVSVRNRAEFEKDRKDAAARQKIEDDKILQDYFKANNIKPKKTNSGLYYVINKAGTGPAAKKGQKVTVIYTGKLLDGRAFDSNIDPAFKHTDPLTFEVGQHRVIDAWEEAATILNKGTKATLYVISGLGYGSQSKGIVKPHAILMFDMDVRYIQ